MSQFLSTDLTIDPFTTSGQQLAAILNRIHAGFLDMHAGTSRPAYAKEGTIWFDTSTSPGTLMYYDGTSDQVLVSEPVPTGGTAGQLLAKIDSTDGNTEWIDPSAVLPTGGTAGQALTKIDDTDGNAEWSDIPTDSLGTPPTGAFLEGGIIGLDYEAVAGTGQVTVQPGACYDSTNSVLLTLDAEYTFTPAIPSSRAPISLFLCSDGTVKADDNTEGTNLSGVTFRWIGCVPSNVSVLETCYCYGGNLTIENQENFATLSTTATPVLKNYGAVVPVERVASVILAIAFAGSDYMRILLYSKVSATYVRTLKRINVANSADQVFLGGDDLGNFYVEIGAGSTLSILRVSSAVLRR